MIDVISGCCVHIWVWCGIAGPERERVVIPEKNVLSKHWGELQPHREYGK